MRGLTGEERRLLEEATQSCEDVPFTNAELRIVASLQRRGLLGEWHKCADRDVCDLEHSDITSLGRLALFADGAAKGMLEGVL